MILQSGKFHHGGRHTEACGARIGSEIMKTPEYQLRKDRETSRREAEFDRYIQEEDRRQDQQGYDLIEAGFQRRMRDNGVQHGTWYGKR